MFAPPYTTCAGAGTWVALLLVACSCILAFVRSATLRRKFTTGPQLQQQQQLISGEAHQRHSQCPPSGCQQRRPGPYGGTEAREQPPDSDTTTSEMLAELLQQFFESSDNVVQWVAKGGLTTLGSLVQAMCDGPLAGPDHQKQALQVSWLLLQVAHAPYLTRCQLQHHVPMQLFAKFMSSVLASPTLPHEVQAAIQRNCCWALNSLCDVATILRSTKQNPDPAAQDGPQQPPPSSASQDLSPLHTGPSNLDAVTQWQLQEAPALLGLSYSHAIVDSGILHILGTLLGKDFGMDTANFATALLASLAVLDDVDAVLADAAQEVLLEPGTSLLLCTLMANQRLGNAATTLHQYLSHMLHRHMHRLVWQLVYDRSVQDLLQAVPSQLALLIAYQLLSQPGQQAMLEFEAQYCVDVAVALAHLITSEQANKLVRVTVPEAEDAQGSEAGHATRTYSLRAMASRMLVGGDRLEELLATCFDELTEAQQQQQLPEDLQPPSQPPSSSAAFPLLVRPWITDTTSTTTRLLAHLESLDMQLSQYRAMHGLGAEDMSSIASSGVMERASVHSFRFEGAPAGAGPGHSAKLPQAPQQLPGEALAAAADRSCCKVTPLDMVSEQSQRLAPWTEHENEQRQPQQQQPPHHHGEELSAQSLFNALASFSAAVPPGARDIPNDEDDDEIQDRLSAQGSLSRADSCSSQATSLGVEEDWGIREDNVVGEDLKRQQLLAKFQAENKTTQNSSLTTTNQTNQDSSLTCSTTSIVCVPKVEPCGKQQDDPPEPGLGLMMHDSWPAASCMLRADLVQASAPSPGSTFLHCPLPNTYMTADDSGSSSRSVSARTLLIDQRSAAATAAAQMLVSRSSTSTTSAASFMRRGSSSCAHTHPATQRGELGAASFVDERLTAAKAGGSTDCSALPELPSSVARQPLPPGAAAPAPDDAAATTYEGPVLVLSYGKHSVCMSKEQYAGVRRLSSLLHSWMSRCAPSQLHTVLRVPGFSDEENCMVLRALVASVAQPDRLGAAGAAGAGAGAVAPGAVEASQAALVWQAADYYQVDFLKDHCEDLLLSTITQILNRDAARGRQQQQQPEASQGPAAAVGPSAEPPPQGQPSAECPAPDALYELLAADVLPLPLQPMRYRGEFSMQVIQETGGGAAAPMTTRGGGAPDGHQQTEQPRAPPAAPLEAAVPSDIACASLTKSFADILDLVGRYHHSSGRLQHLLAALLMRHMQQLVMTRSLADMLSRHKEELMPGLVSLMRDRLVSIVMLSDTLDEEVSE